MPFEKGNIITKGKKNGMYKHGMSRTKFHKTWITMKFRCLNKNGNKNHQDYKSYILRGINVYDRWLKFENFKDDMYKSYLDHIEKFGEKDTTIDRINNDKGYYFENCRWATHKEQANNKRNTLKFKIKNKLYTIRSLSNKYNISYKNLFNRLVVYKWLVKDAIINKKLYGKH